MKAFVDLIIETELNNFVSVDQSILGFHVTYISVGVNFDRNTDIGVSYMFTGSDVRFRSKYEKF